ncbi:hypothetical protein GCM10020331_092020 [Ectobacillus funiculus]
MGSYYDKLKAQYDKLKAQMDEYNHLYNNNDHGNMSRKCCCCCCKCITLCEQRKAAFQATNPHLRFDLNIVYQFFNDQVTFTEAIQRCNAMPGYTLITLQELTAISNDFNTAGLCQMLLWTTNNGVPTLVYFVPGSLTPIIPVPTPSLSCLAYGIYLCRSY